MQEFPETEQQTFAGKSFGDFVRTKLPEVPLLSVGKIAAYEGEQQEPRRYNADIDRIIMSSPSGKLIGQQEQKNGQS